MKRLQGITTPGEGPALAAPPHSSLEQPMAIRLASGRYRKTKQKTKLNRRHQAQNYHPKYFVYTTCINSDIYIFVRTVLVLIFAIVHCKCVHIMPYTVLYS